MVNKRVKVRDKFKLLKKSSKILLITIIFIAILATTYYTGFKTKKPTNEIVLENPLKNLVFENTNEAGQVNYDKVVEQGAIEFNTDYINFLLAALGVSKLHKSLVGYGKPKIKLIVGGETWSSEIENGNLKTNKESIKEEDLRISLTKEEAVKALLSSNIQEFMKSSARSGNTNIELVANKVELGSKGYLAMYKDLTGEEIEAEE